MPASQDPISGLYYGWDTGESGMKNQLDQNALKIGALMNIIVKSRSITTPPASPADGDCYIPATGATGVWATLVKQVVVWRATGVVGWQPYVPKNGWRANIMDEGAYGTMSTYRSSDNTWSPGSANA